VNCSCREWCKADIRIPPSIIGHVDLVASSEHDRNGISVWLVIDRGCVHLVYMGASNSTFYLTGAFVVLSPLSFVTMALDSVTRSGLTLRKRSPCSHSHHSTR